MNYETATDLELEIKLAEIVLKSRYKKAKSIEFDGSHHCFWVDNVGFSSFKIDEYCTDISATWPLMIEHNLTLSPCSWPEDSIGQWGCETNDDRDISVFCENPLRAIVICLIKVLESKQEKPSK